MQFAPGVGIAARLLWLLAMKKEWKHRLVSVTFKSIQIMASKKSNDSIKRTGELLLSGWKLLNSSCPMCNTALMSKGENLRCPMCDLAVVKEADQVREFPEVSCVLLSY
jgi:tRNA(Ile2) C34 agmatinyltransferase TiaS